MKSACVGVLSIIPPQSFE